MFTGGLNNNWGRRKFEAFMKETVFPFADFVVAVTTSGVSFLAFFELSITWSWIFNLLIKIPQLQECHQ